MLVLLAFNSRSEFDSNLHSHLYLWTSYPMTSSKCCQIFTEQPSSLYLLSEACLQVWFRLTLLSLNLAFRRVCQLWFLLLPKWTQISRPKAWSTVKFSYSPTIKTPNLRLLGFQSDIWKASVCGHKNAWKSREARCLCAFQFQKDERSCSQVLISVNCEWEGMQKGSYPSMSRCFGFLIFLPWYEPSLSPSSSSIALIWQEGSAAAVPRRHCLRRLHCLEEALIIEEQWGCSMSSGGELSPRTWAAWVACCVCSDPWTLSL